MSRFLPVLFGAFLAACSSTHFNETSGQKHGERTKTQNQGQKETKGPSDFPSSAQTVGPKTPAPVHRGNSEPFEAGDYKMPEGSAVIPIAVGGASLTCERDPSIGMLCQEPNFAASSFEVSKAYYASEMEKIWMPTTFVRRDDSSYAVSLPEDLKISPLNVAVMLVDAQNRYVADTDFEEPHTIQNLAQNASFEDFVSFPDDPDSQTNRLISPDQQTYWKASRTRDNVSSGCPANIEYENSEFTSTFLAADGAQYFELAARCSEDSASRSHLSLNQTLALKKGHIYRVTYAFRKPAGLTGTLSLRASFGSDTQRADPVTSSNWVYASYVKGAESDEVTLSFEEIGPIHGRGTQIDHIMVVDLTELGQGQ